MTRRRALAPALRRTGSLRGTRAALTSENIDILQHKLDSLFRREDADPAWIWCQGMTVKLHSLCHFDRLQNASSFLISRARKSSTTRRGGNTPGLPSVIDEGEASDGCQPLGWGGTSP